MVVPVVFVREVHMIMSHRLMAVPVAAYRRRWTRPIPPSSLKQENQASRMARHPDISLLFGTRIVRLFCYGSLSVVLALCLAEAGLREDRSV
jgi:hypothetical protein